MSYEATESSSNNGSQHAQVARGLKGGSWQCQMVQWLAIKFPQLVIPQGALVYYSGMVQAAYNQYVQFKDSSGHTIFVMTGSSPDGHKPTAIGSGSFTANDPTGLYSIGIGINGTTSGSMVLWDEDVINLGNTIYLSRYTYIGEDGADQDYNDCYVTVHWFLYVGLE